MYRWPPANFTPRFECQSNRFPLLRENFIFLKIATSHSLKFIQFTDPYSTITFLSPPNLCILCLPITNNPPPRISNLSSSPTLPTGVHTWTKMKVLCLHGKGTSGAIFKSQTCNAPLKSYPQKQKQKIGKLTPPPQPHSAPNLPKKTSNSTS